MPAFLFGVIKLTPRRLVLSLFVVFLLLVAIGVILGLSQSQKPDPTVQGKPVSTWLIELNGPEATAQASEIFRQAGPEILPALQHALAVEGSFMQQLLRHSGKRLPDRVRVPIFQSQKPYQAEQLRIGAAIALHHMGTNAIPAVPDLNIALSDPNKNVGMWSARALGRMGRVSVASLAESARHPDPTRRQMALYGLSILGPEAAEAGPIVVKALADPAKSVRDQAASTFREIGRPAVASLVESWEQLNLAGRKSALQLLAEMGPLARTAEPLLRKLVDHPDPELQALAQAALLAIRSGT